VTLKEELQAMQSYLEISRLRFGERMTFEVCVESTTELVLIPTMLLQPLLENAVKYGIDLSDIEKLDIEKSDETGKITLTCNLEDGLLQIKITNPLHQLPLQPQPLHESYELGLQSTKDRLKLLYQEQARVTLDNRDTDTVTLTIMLPAQQMELTNE